MKHAYILFSFLLCHIYIFAADDLIYPPTEEYSHDEGFSAGTKIKTAAGYVPIEEIQQNDKIISYTPAGLTDQEVIQISKKLLANHIKIVTDNQTIVAGSHQKFYYPAENRWIEAQDILANQMLRKKLAEYIVVRQIERINQPATTYTLTVQGHTFYVTHNDICVHNSDTVCGYAQIVLQLGLIVCKHPVLELIGQGLNVARGCSIMHSILNARIQEQASTAVSIQISPEKIAYERTKRELESMRAEFKQIIDGLKLCGKGFSYEFLHAFASSSTTTLLGFISDEEEARYNDQQRANLSYVRQLELHRLEKEILDLQITLAFHCYTLIDNRNKALTTAKTAFEELLKWVKIWDANHHVMSLEIAMAHYDKENFFQEFLQDLDEKNKELVLAIQYYKHPHTASVLKKTSNIANFLAQEEQMVLESERFVQDKQTALSKYKQITEQFFRRHNSPVTYNAAGAMQRRKNQKAKDLAEAKRQRAAITAPSQAPKPPQKDNKDKDKEKYPYGRYEDASYHHKNSSGPKSAAPKDGQKALDNSFLVSEKGNTSYQRRIGVSEGQYVVLDQTSEGVFHGHTRDWKDLTDKMQAILRKEGKVL